MAELKYIWFDLGYTLVYMNREKHFQNLLFELEHRLELQELQIAYHITDKLFMREHQGLLCRPKEEYIKSYYEKLLDYLKIKVDIEKILYSFQEDTEKERLWVAYENSIEVLSMLKQKGIKTGLISNWDETARSVLKRNALEDLLDRIIISSEVGLLKPDRKIFELALENEGVTPEECLYVGDNYYDDAVGSRQVGMKSVIINPYGSLGIEEIKDIDIISNIKDLPLYIERYKGFTSRFNFLGITSR